MKKSSPFFLALSTLLIFNACNQVEKKSENNQELDTNLFKNQSNETFDDYWYSGNAEITSYELQQARYGEIRKGEAVLIFVTEDFLVNSQVKKESETDEAATSVLKLNFLRKFPTGIYDYSMMTSTFNPINQEKYTSPIKSTTSSQEWCGHSWMQLNQNNKGFDITSFSYFQAEGDKQFELANEAIIEDALWTQIRINPDLIPRGERMIFPSAHFLRFSHNELKAYKAVITFDRNPDKKYRNLMVNYPELKRFLKITFQKEFPHEIISWEESHKSGFGTNAKTMKTTAFKKGQQIGPYWEQNSIEDSHLRDSLKLK